MWAGYALDAHARVDVIDAPDPLQALSLDFVRDQHLRVVNGTAEDEYISLLIGAAFAEAERVTNRALAPQTLALVTDRFPNCGHDQHAGVRWWAGGAFCLPLPPLVSVTSIAYVDHDGVTQTLNGGSPAAFQVSAPTGPRCARGRVAPLYGDSWPIARCQIDAVRVTYAAGYQTSGAQALPSEITAGMLLIIGELYQQRSLSVDAARSQPTILTAMRLFEGYAVF